MAAEYELLTLVETGMIPRTYINSHWSERWSLGNAVDQPREAAGSIPLGCVSFFLFENHRITYVSVNVS